MHFSRLFFVLRHNSCFDRGRTRFLGRRNVKEDSDPLDCVIVGYSFLFLPPTVQNLLAVPLLHNVLHRLSKRINRVPIRSLL
jgi:hypothetical protein